MVNDLLSHLGFYVYTGGTYDRLHRGHKESIRRAFEFAGTHDLQVVIFIKDDDLARAKGNVLPYNQRLEDLNTYLQELGRGDTVIVRLGEQSFQYWANHLSNDPRAKVSFAKYDATYATAYVNLIRGKNGIPPIEIVVEEVSLAADGQPINSTRIRAGEIDREGRLSSNYRTKPTVIGIGGRVCTGKSAVCEHLGDRYDVVVIDADTLRPTSGGLEEQTLKLLFEADFSSLKEKSGNEALLETILTKIEHEPSLANKYNTVHLPQMAGRIKKTMQTYSDRGIIIVEWALFGESNMFPCLDHYIHLTVSRTEQIERLERRYPNLRRTLLEVMADAQLPDNLTIQRAKQATKADIVINSGRTPQETSLDIVDNLIAGGIYFKPK